MYNKLSIAILCLSCFAFDALVFASIAPRNKTKFLHLHIILAGSLVIYVFGTRFLWRELVTEFSDKLFSPVLRISWRVLLVVVFGMAHLSLFLNLFGSKDPSTIALACWIFAGFTLILIFWFGVFRLVFFALQYVGCKNALVAKIDQQKYHTWILIIMTTAYIWKAHNTAMQPPVIVSQTIPIAKLPPSLNGTKLALLSDIHLGSTVGFTKLTEIVDLTNALKPDIVILAGDFADGTVSDLQEAAKPLEDLDSPLGKYFVTGNHEYMIGDVENWFEFLRSHSFKILHNSNVKIYSEFEPSDWFCLLGTDDLHGKRYAMFSDFKDHGMDLPKAYRGCDENHAAILVAHQPNAAKAALMSEYSIQLVLSGHTHGGQIFPFSWIIYMTNAYYAGLYSYDSTSYVYVTQGSVYYGFPLRFGSHREITEITLITS